MCAQLSADELARLALGDLRLLAAEQGIAAAENMPREELLARLKLQQQLNAMDPGQLARLADEQQRILQLGGRQVQPPDPQGTQQFDDRAAPAPESAPAWLPIVTRLSARAIQAVAIIASLLALVGFVLLAIGAARLPGLVNRMISEARVSASSTALVVQNVSEVLALTSSTLHDSGPVIREFAATVEKSEDLVLSLRTLLEQQAPQTLIDVSETLLAAQAGAKAMDSVLRGLAVFPFLTGISYAPQQPLDSALFDAAASIVPLTVNLGDLSDDLVHATRDWDLLVLDLEEVALDVELLAIKMRRLHETAEKQSASLAELQEQLQEAPQRLMGWLWAGVGLAGFMLLWVLLAQVALFQVGEAIADGRL